MGRGKTGELRNRFSGDEDPEEDAELLGDEYDYFQLPFATACKFAITDCDIFEVKTRERSFLGGCATFIFPLFFLAWALGSSHALDDVFYGTSMHPDAWETSMLSWNMATVNTSQGVFVGKKSITLQCLRGANANKTSSGYCKFTPIYATPLTDTDGVPVAVHPCAENTYRNIYKYVQVPAGKTVYPPISPGWVPTSSHVQTVHNGDYVYLEMNLCSSWSPEDGVRIEIHGDAPVIFINGSSDGSTGTSVQSSGLRHLPRIVGKELRLELQSTMKWTRGKTSSFVEWTVANSEVVEISDPVLAAKAKNSSVSIVSIRASKVWYYESVKRRYTVGGFGGVGGAMFFLLAGMFCLVHAGNELLRKSGYDKGLSKSEEIKRDVMKMHKENAKLRRQIELEELDSVEVPPPPPKAKV